MAKNSALTVGIVLVLVVLLGLVAWLVVSGGTQQSQIEGAKGAIEATGDCETAPSVELSMLNAINPGTEVTGFATTDVILNGNYIGNVSLSSRSFSFGDDLEILVTKGDYLDEVLVLDDLLCGANPVSGEMFASDDGTLKITNDDGTTLRDNTDGAGVNQTSSTTPIQVEVKHTCNTDEAQGDVLFVIEASNTTVVDDLVLSGEGISKDDIPSFHTTESTDSSAITKAFLAKDVPNDGKSITYFLNIEPETGARIANTSIYVTAYTVQNYVETDGSFQFGVENEDGTTKYEDTYDYDFFIGN